MTASGALELAESGVPGLHHGETLRRANRRKRCMDRLDGKNKHTLTAEKSGSDRRLIDGSLIILPSTSPAQIRPTDAPSTLQLRLDLVCLLPLVPRNTQNIGLATYLTVFHVALPTTCRHIYNGFVPLPATCTRKTGIAGHLEFSCHLRFQSIGTGPSPRWDAASNRTVAVTL